MFLATTALSEFWDHQKEILFLGSWCLRYERRCEWSSLHYQVMRSPWNDRARFYEATLYTDLCYERILRELSDHLGSIHHTKNGLRYWRLIIGPWLLHFVHSVYDRYVHLVQAFDQYGSLDTIVLDPQCYVVPRDTSEFITLTCSDHYNLQMFSVLIEALGYKFPEKIFQHVSSYPPSGGRDFPSRNGIMARAFDLGAEAARIIKGREWQVALCDMYWPRSRAWSVALRSGLRVLPLDVSSDWAFAVPKAVSDSRRESLAGLGYADGFERVMVQLLPQYLPSLYLEGYESAREEILKRYRVVPPVIASAIGWYFNEPFKFFSAEATLRASRLLAVQHGGGYGVFRFSPLELHESRLADSFLVWGWKEPETLWCRNVSDPRFLFLEAAALGKRKPYMQENILFVATDHPRYLYRFHSAPVGTQWEDYLDWQIRFFSAVSGRLLPRISFRPYMHDYGHGIWDRISEAFPQVRLDSHRSLVKAVTRSRLVIVDFLSTTFLEVLTMNNPAIFFWDPDRWEIRDHAQPYFAGLRDAGILWDSPESAAKYLSKIYDNPWSWWNGKMVQEIRRHLLNRFALTRRDWSADWVRILESEVDSAYRSSCERISSRRSRS